MAREVKVSDIGTEVVEITAVMVKVGDRIVAEQPIVVVEADRASGEVASSEAGTVQEIKVAAGDKVTTGSLLLLLANEPSAGIEAAAESAVPVAGASTPIVRAGWDVADTIYVG